MSELPIRVGFETFGCRSNHSDTVELQAALLELGIAPISAEELADVYVVNTCTVTDDADKTAIRAVRRIRAQAPGARIVVTGCLAEADAGRITAVDGEAIVIGPGKRKEVLHSILSHFGETTTGAENDVSLETPRKRKRGAWKAQPLIEPLSSSTPGPGEPFGSFASRSRYHLRVQEGCENTCTFCIIPFTRGGLVSRPIELILEDIQKLAAAGYEEVVLTGTHLGGYGEDRAQSLADLLRALSKASAIPRVRLSSLDPNDVTPEIIDILAESHIFCRHLHICIQAFSDSVLKRMNRRYRLSEVYEIMHYISQRLPNVCLGSDVITGFPGESRQDVEQAIQVFLGLPFSYLHVFPYSERSGTAATRLSGSVEKAERRRRTARFRALSESRKREFLLSLLGQQLEIILEHGKQYLHGTSREFAPVRVHVSDERRDEHSTLTPGKKILVNSISYDEEEGVLVCVY